MSDREHSRSLSHSRSASRKYSSRRSRSSSRGGGGHRSSRYRTRSRSPPAKYSKRYSRSRSHSRSYSRRSDSRSPKRNGDGKPDISVLKPKCLGVFGLSIFTKETQIRDIFSRFGALDRVQIIFDAKTGRSRGYCFVYFANHEDAKRACDQCSGMELDDRRIRVDFSITQRAHSPTPGVYMGKPTKSFRPRSGGGGGGGEGGSGDRSRYKSDHDRSNRHSGRRRSPSPYKDRRRRHDRSRSRSSYSPRNRRVR